MSQAVQGHPGWVTVENSDKTWSTEGGNGESLQYSCLENPMNSMKRQKDMTPEDEPPCWKMSSMLLGRSREIAPERNKWLGQSGNNAQLWVCLVVKVKPNTVKNNTA